MDLTGRGWEDVNGIYPTLGRENRLAVVFMAMNFLGP